MCVCARARVRACVRASARMTVCVCVIINKSGCVRVYECMLVYLREKRAGEAKPAPWKWQSGYPACH